MFDNKKSKDQCDSAWQHTNRQNIWVSKYRLPLLKLTTFVPEHMANSEVAEKIFSLAYQEMHRTLEKHNYKVLESECFQHLNGRGLLMVISGAASTELKRAMIKIENQHALGGLFNFDVLNREGKMITRKASELSPRRCVLCNNAASFCAAAHKHSPEAMENQIVSMLGNYLVSFDESNKEAVGA
ncbi:citrate lyase holo-[acyl-carrier protein] synthase [Vibrio sp. WXL103]|uniref:citrate lyase holo-[acyl-carrier protein] synthase n=1 Tax=unclassified Vibrio TaxID=2614977 RepID=UPI003EC6C1FC